MSRKTKKMRHALLMSVISMMLCCAMLVGTTFAWFTDEVTSEGNIIKSGTLDIDLMHKTEGDWVSIEAHKDHKVFDYELWEPGYTQVETLKVVNKGNLALKFKLTTILDLNTVEVGPNNAKLADVIDVYITDGEYVAANGERVDLSGWKLCGTLSELMADEDGLAYGVLLPKDTKAENNTKNEPVGEIVVTVALKMQESAGNDYQNLSAGDIYLSLSATQYTYEDDSFDETYDKDADYDGEISNEASLIAALANGGDYKMVNDITLTETVKVPEGVEFTLDLDDNTLTGSILAPKANLTINNGKLNNTDASASAIEINAGELTLTNVNIDSARHAVRIDGAVTATIDGGTYKAAAYNGTGTYHAVNVSGDAEVTINGGTFIGPKGTAADSGSAVTVRDTSTVTINGGDFSGGKNNTLSGSSATLTVKGGTFDQDPSAYVAEGYVAVNNNGTYSIMKGDAYVHNSAELVAAINAGKQDIVLADGTYTMPTSLNGSGVSLQNKTLTLTGTKGVVLDVSNVDERDQFVTGANLKFDGVTLNFGTNNYMGFANTASLTYEDCAINGLQFLSGNGTFSFVDCDLNSNGAEHSVWTWSSIGEKNVSFTGCDFTYGDRAVNCYGEKGTTNVSFKDCTFTKVAGKETTGAIETNSASLTALNLTIDNCTVDEGDLWWISTWDSKGGANTYATVDGKVASNAALKAAINAGKTEIELADGTIEFNWEDRNLLNGVTIIGNSPETSTLLFTGYGPDADGWSLNGLTLKNVTVVDKCKPENSTYSYYHSYFYVSGLKATNVVFETGVKTVNAASTFTDCTFVSGYYWNYSTQAYSTEEMYGLVANGDVTVNGCSFTGFRGIDVSAACNVTVNNSTLNVTNTEKDAINVKADGATVTVNGEVQ